MKAYYAHSNIGDTIVIPDLQLALEVNSEFFREFTSGGVNFERWRGPYRERRCDPPEEYGEIIAVRDEVSEAPSVMDLDLWRTRARFYLGECVPA